MELECNIDHSGSDSTINAFALQVKIPNLFSTPDTIFVRFEARVRDITRNPVYTGAIAQVGEFILDSHIFFNSHCNNDQWHEYIITIDNAATKVKCDKILIHVDSSKTSLYGPANKYHRMHVLLGAQSPE